MALGLGTKSVCFLVFSHLKLTDQTCAS